MLAAGCAIGETEVNRESEPVILLYSGEFNGSGRNS
jgi:hypothetical protein